MLADSQLLQPLVYVERLQLIQNVCRDEALRNLSHTAVSKFVLDRIFVCDKHKILFCQTPKVGNTQWKKVLIVLNGACHACFVSHLGDFGIALGGPPPRPPSHFPQQSRVPISGSLPTQGSPFLQSHSLSSYPSLPLSS